MRPEGISLRENPKGLMLNCNGAFSAWTHEDSRPNPGPAGQGMFSPGKGLGQSAMDMWEACALNKACVTPPGTNRGNHRQDQAALTLALATHGVFCHRKSFVHAHGVKGGRANAKAVLHNYAPTVDAVPLASSGDVGTCTGTDNPPEK